MLATNVDSCGHIKNAEVLSLVGRCCCNVRFDFVKFFLFDIAVKQQCCIVFVVISDGTELVLLFVWIFSELFKIGNEVVELGHLDESLNDIAWV